MIATLQFDLSQEEDRLLHAEAVRAKDAFYVLREMQAELRAIDKHGRDDMDAETVRQIRSGFISLINDNDLSTTIEGQA